MSMYHGTNPTALQSRKWLADSLTELMEDHPYSQITIRSICQRADLSRQTFYNCFATKEEVLRFCLQSQYERQFQRLQSQNGITVGETAEAFAAVLQENRPLLLLMLQNGLESIITDEIAKCVTLFASRFATGDKDNPTLPYQTAMLSGALAHVLLYWIRQEYPIPLERLKSLLTDFLAGRLFPL